MKSYCFTFDILLDLFVLLRFVFLRLSFFEFLLKITLNIYLFV